MASQSGGSRSTGGGGSGRRRASSSARRSSGGRAGSSGRSKRASGSGKRAASSSRGRAASSRGRGSSSGKRAASSGKRAASSARSASRSKRGAASRRSSSARSDKSLQAFRDALERSRTALESSVTIPRERMQEVVDDAVKRGRMTRGDANELVSKLVTRSRKATDEMMRDLERLLEHARREVESRRTATGKQATRAAGRVGRAARDAADRPLAEADRIRRRAGVRAGGPITAYDQLTAAQITARLGDLSPAELRKVRTQEQRGKGRKTILAAIDKRLAK